MSVRVLEVLSDLRPAQVKCNLCGVIVHITYPPMEEKT